MERGGAWGGAGHGEGRGDGRGMEQQSLLRSPPSSILCSPWGLVSFPPCCALLEEGGWLVWWALRPVPLLEEGGWLASWALCPGCRAPAPYPFKDLCSAS